MNKQSAMKLLFSCQLIVVPRLGCTLQIIIMGLRVHRSDQHLRLVHIDGGADETWDTLAYATGEAGDSGPLYRKS